MREANNWCGKTACMLIAAVAMFGVSEVTLAKEPGSASAIVNIVRPESTGAMNLAACLISISSMSSSGSAIESVDIVDMEGKTKSKIARPRKGEFSLLGGDTAMLRIEPGRFQISAVTPIGEQPQGSLGLVPPWPWKANPVAITAKMGETATILLLPGSWKSAWTGSWCLSETRPDGDLSQKACEIERPQIAPDRRPPAQVDVKPKRNQSGRPRE